MAPEPQLAESEPLELGSPSSSRVRKASLGDRREFVGGLRIKRGPTIGVKEQEQKVELLPDTRAIVKEKVRGNIRQSLCNIEAFRKVNNFPRERLELPSLKSQ